MVRLGDELFFGGVGIERSREGFGGSDVRIQPVMVADGGSLRSGGAFGGGGV